VTWKIDPAKLDDATRESLDVFEFNRQTRAANTELLYQLALAAKDAEWEKAEKKDRKAQAKLDKKAGITPDVERAAPVGSAPAAPLNPNAAAEREKQLRRHVEEWRTNWLRKIIDKAMPIGVARRLFHWAWAELSSNHSSYDAQFGAFSLTARGELFREIASESSKSRKSWLATTAPWPAKKLDEFEFAVAHRLLTLNGEAVPHVPPALVEELAEELEIDEDARWEWTPDFLNLFRIPELEELVDELKLDVSVAGFTKKALVSTIVAKAPKRQRPKLLVAIAKAARKGGKS
ncbi:MAG TPA: hypothetical protein VGE52_06850, partial [Pirellulales bacterium]